MMSGDKKDAKMHNLDLLPYPAQFTLVRHLQSCSADIINLGAVFPRVALVADPRKTTWIFDQIFPVLARYLNRTDAFKCRTVCSSWMQAVDFFLQNLGLAEPDYVEPDRSLSYDLEHWRKDAFGLRSCWIENSRDISNFMDMMGAHSGNPFMSRCVQINNQDNPRYWEEVQQFLERFGSEIWKLRLGCYCAYSKATVIIRDCLAHVPNVKNLSIEYNGIDRSDLTEEEEAEIQRDLQDTPFPPLSNLTHLDWSMCPDFYTAALPQYSQHLVNVKLMDPEFMDTFDSELHGTFPKLKLLVVRVSNENALTKLQELGSPLKSVTILCSQRIAVRTYIQVFHTFAATLESFNIEFDEEPFFDWNEAHLANQPGLDETLEFPVLKCARFENPAPTESLDALLCVKPGIQFLQIQTYIRGWVEHFRNYQQPLFEKLDGELVEVHGYLENMHESKIWTLMPQLKTITVDAYNPENWRVHTTYKRESLGEEENLNR